MKLSPYSPLLLLIAAGTVAMAQGTQTASISGQVTDQKGNPIAGAEVRATSPALQLPRNMKTDTDGRFSLRLLPPGDYKLVIVKDGFNSATLNGHVGLERSWAPAVKLGAVGTTTVEIVASAIALDRTEVKSATNFTKEQIDGLPINRGGENGVLDIAYLAPSVVPNTNADRGGVQIRGSMGTGNLIMVDGQNVMDNLYQGQRVGVIFDAVEETQILTGAIPAEYGNVEGGVINSVTKTGGDDFSAALRYDISNPSWNAVTPMDDRSTGYPNKNATQMSFTVGGPIVPSKLWFFAGYFADKPTTTIPFSTGAANSPYPSYVQTKVDLRRELKLTWAINEDNTLTAAYHNNNKDSNPQDYGGGEPTALSRLLQDGSFWNLSWRSLLTKDLVFFLKYGEKRQLFPAAPATPGAYAPLIYNNADGLAYGTAWFDPNDPKPDDRRNKTASGKLTYFWQAQGSHETDFGFDYYQGTTEASGMYTPNYTNYFGGNYNYYISVDGYDLPSRLVYNDPDPIVTGAALYAYEYIPDRLTVNTYGLFINDKWVLNDRWSTNLGLRADRYDAKATSAGSISHNTSFSPRLGAKFDTFGDNVWVWGASYNKLQGRVLESILQGTTYVNNPLSRTYAYLGPVSAPGGVPDLPLSTVTDVTNYDTTPYSVTNGPVNVKFPSNLKPQAVDEYQLSLTHAFKSTWFGEGYLKLTYVNKAWSNIIDYTGGNSGQVFDPASASTLYIRQWRNNPDAKRFYRALELEGSTQLGNFTFGGNVVWSTLEGNYVGEDKASPGLGQGVDWFTVQDGVPMYDRNIVNPRGYLPGHIPLRTHLIPSYHHDFGIGRFTLGFIYTFESGAHYDDRRAIGSYQQLNPAIDLQADGNPSSFYQYLGNRRGQGVFPSTSTLDMSVQQEFKLWKFGTSRSVAGFVKADIKNLFNHQEQKSFDVLYNASGAPGLTDPWSPANPTSFHQAAGPQDFITARTLSFSVGLKF